MADMNPFQKKRFLVMGLGTSGVAVAEKLLQKGASVLASDSNPSLKMDEPVQALARQGCSLHFGPQDASLLNGIDVLIPSPGIPLTHPVLHRAQELGIPLLSEVEIGYQLTNSPILAVTGTDGKSTTVRLLEHILRWSGRKVIAAGNIGNPLVRVCEEEWDWIVLEVSSFQLSTIQRFRPRIALLLNIEEDHLNWHKDFEEYKSAKLRIFENQTQEDTAVINGDEPWAESAVKQCRSRVLTYSLQPWDAEGKRQKAPGRNFPYEPDAYLRDDVLTLRWEGEEIPVLNRDDLPLLGEANVSNALGALLCARVAGVNLPHLREGLRTFSPLPHRLEYIGMFRGVKYYNDSKATTPHAVLAAIQALSRGGWLTLLLGGSEKNLNYTRLAEMASEKCKAVVLMGEARQRLFQAFLKHGNGKAMLVVVDSFAEGVKRAMQVTPPNSVVLLSPACASFDEFHSYEERGETFKRLVKQYAEKNEK